MLECGAQIFWVAPSTRWGPRRRRARSISGSALVPARPATGPQLPNAVLGAACARSQVGYWVNSSENVVIRRDPSSVMTNWSSSLIPCRCSGSPM